MATEASEMVSTNLAYAGMTAESEKELPKPGDAEHIMNLRQSADQMPRFKVGNEPRCFKSLLECTDLDFDTKKDAQELLLMASINQRIMKEVIEVGPNMCNWDSVGEGEDGSDVVYTLSLVDAILRNNQSDLPEEAQALLGDISDWVTRFSKSGGLGNLMALAENVLSKLKQAKKDKAA